MSLKGISITVGAIGLIGAILWLGISSSNASNNATSDAAFQEGRNVSVTDGTQIIHIKAKAGYTPGSTTAQANMPTILKVTTSSTFDCSSTLVISSLNYMKGLPASGTTDIAIPAQKSGSELQGACSMGMYTFRIVFH